MKKPLRWFAVILSVVIVCAVCLGGVYYSFRRPYRSAVAASGVEEALAYAVMKAESGFREDAVSKDGATGLMQIMPSTAEFICRRENVIFSYEKLKDGEYNVTLGCAYLKYLLGKFALFTAVAAYNAGEGAVSLWLAQEEYSSDGVTLIKIPYPETAAYVKKVEKFRKIYEKLY